jgi:menaquinone-dependent protoporphyrinogen IX oxidase
MAKALIVYITRTGETQQIGVYLSRRDDAGDENAAISG